MLVVLDVVAVELDVRPRHEPEKTHLRDARRLMEDSGRHVQFAV